VTSARQPRQGRKAATVRFNRRVRRQPGPSFPGPGPLGTNRPPDRSARARAVVRIV